MLLRASGQVQGGDPDIQAVTAGAEVDPGIAGGSALLRFVDAVLSREADEIATARNAVIAAVGAKGAADAACVIGNFERMNRIADGIGIPVESAMTGVISEINDELDLRRFASASHSAEASPLSRAFGRVARKALPLIGRLTSRREAR